MRLLPCLLALTLAACARDETVYPSLAPRTLEELGFEEPAPTPTAAAAVDPKLDLEIAAATARLDKAVRDFAAAAGRAEAAARAARGAAVGADSWIAAQTALAELDGLRAETSEVLADLERLAADRAATLAPDYPGLERERERARGELDGQAAAIGRLGAGLAPT